MKFQPTKEYRFPWEVTVHYPHAENAGDVVVETFTGLFRVMDEAEAKAIIEARANAATVDQLLDASKTHVRKVLVGWRRETVLDEFDEPVEFSPEKLEEYLLWAPFRDGVINAYAAAIHAEPAKGN